MDKSKVKSIADMYDSFLFTEEEEYTEDENDVEGQSSPSTLSNLDLFMNVVKKEEEQSDKDDILGLKSSVNKRKKSAIVSSIKNSSSTNIKKDILIKLAKDINIEKFLLNGMKRVWEIDSEYQEEVMSEYIHQVRNVPKELVPLYMGVLKEMNAFFNPSGEYLIEVFGEPIKSMQYDMFYNQEVCKFNDRLMMPLYFMDGTVRGMVGYSPLENYNGDVIKYLYPSSSVLRKSVILFCSPEEYKKAIKDGYIILTDGLMDKIAFTMLGYNAASFCGSAITDFHRLALSKIPVKIIARDMDKAGTHLLDNARKLLTGKVRGLGQLQTNDFDDYFKGKVEGVEDSIYQVAVLRIERFREEFDKWKRSGFIQDLMTGKGIDVTKWVKQATRNEIES